MSAEIIDLEQKKLENMEHLASEVICVSCHHRFWSVRPSTCYLKQLQCSGCMQSGYIIETGERIE